MKNKEKIFFLTSRIEPDLSAKQKEHPVLSHLAAPGIEPDPMVR
jgi:hypothetical protein